MRDLTQQHPEIQMLSRNIRICLVLVHVSLAHVPSKVQSCSASVLICIHLGKENYLKFCVHFYRAPILKY